MSQKTAIKEFVNIIYNGVDEAIKERRYVCEKGCSHCCYQPIETVCWEITNMIGYIKNEMSEGDFSQVRKNIIE